jgi:iron complex transport system ATP-binding protein
MLPARLELDHVTVELARRAILRDVSLDLKVGDLQILIGPNGAGKTTLFRAALGLVPVQQGAIRLDGRSIASWSGRERAARIGWLPQHELVQEEVRVLDLVSAARFRFSEARAHTESRALAALARVGADPFAERRFFQLSGGEQQRVALAALLAQEAPLLLLDEPGNHLDPAQQIEIYRLIGRLRHEGFGILCITHDLDLINHALHPGNRPTPLSEEGASRTSRASASGSSRNQPHSEPRNQPRIAPSGSESVRVLGLREGRSSFSVEFQDPALRTHLEELYDVAVRMIDEEGQRHFLITRPLQESPR